MTRELKLANASTVDIMETIDQLRSEFGACTLRTLAAHLHLHTATVHTRLKNMRKAGLVTWSRMPGSVRTLATVDRAGMRAIWAARDQEAHPSSAADGDAPSDQTAPAPTPESDQPCAPDETDPGAESLAEAPTMYVYGLTLETLDPAEDHAADPAPDSSADEPQPAPHDQTQQPAPPAAQPDAASPSTPRDPRELTDEQMNSRLAGLAKGRATAAANRAAKKAAAQERSTPEV